MAKNLILKQSKQIGKKLLKKRKAKQHKLNNALLNKVFSKLLNVFCHWCKTEVFRGEGSNLKDNTATVDHIYDIKDIRRYLVSEEENTVVSCHKCNQERNVEEVNKRRYIFNRTDIIKLIDLL